MVNRRTVVRTPRKQKVWAYNRGTGSGEAVTAGVSIERNLLDTFKTDMGLTRPPAGCTAMRIVGSLALGNLGDVSSIGLVDVTWGICWLPNQVATASAGDAQIPDPEEPGTREAAWIQRGVLMGVSTAGSTTRYADQGQLLSFIHLDITQMRKQPGADFELCLVTHANNLGDGSVHLWANLQVMLALA